MSFLLKSNYLIDLIKKNLIVQICLILIFYFLSKFAFYIFGDKNGFATGQLASSFTILIYGLLIYLLIKNSFERTLKLNFELNKSKLVIIFIFGLVIRISLALLGHNFDLESYEIVSELVLNGKNLYLETSRYNYGPIWAYLLAFLRFLSNVWGYNQMLFHILIVFVLFIFEFLFAFLISKQHKNNNFLLLLLFNPASIIIIGHHSQFDIIAILIGYLAYLKLIKKEILIGVFLLGISLITKHILIFLPLFLIFKKEFNLKQKLLILSAPAFMFLFTFLPFWEAKDQIIANVFSYQHGFGKSFLKQFFDIIIPDFVTPLYSNNGLNQDKFYKLFWILLLIYIGYLTSIRQNNLTFEIYLLAMFATALAISEQYILIAISGIFFFLNNKLIPLFLFLTFIYLQFISEHNTAKYFNLKNLGIDIPRENYYFSLKNIQFIAFIILIIELYSFKKQPLT